MDDLLGSMVWGSQKRTILGRSGWVITCFGGRSLGDRLRRHFHYVLGFLGDFHLELSHFVSFFDF